MRGQVCIVQSGFNIRGQSLAGKIDLRGNHLRGRAKSPGSERNVELFVFGPSDQRQRARGPAIDDYVFSFTVESDLVIGEVSLRQDCRLFAR